ncbi:hypothetical protein Fcan01_24880 [Folsomia candida]|uniref:Polymerase nucleotidyl transferase domain-containing protein n=1 Tax=Folsomia candida TaxID=158441 RepID=A0A226D5A3_FOLCA|nr:hypothetical protein Fcan01_24880 [Folsomia candida]
MAQPRIERVKLLQTLIDAQKPKKEYVAAGRAAAQAIFLSLQKREKLSVAEVRFAGSIEKGTSRNTSDFDLVVFLNNEKPPSLLPLLPKSKRPSSKPGYPVG